MLNQKSASTDETISFHPRGMLASIDHRNDAQSQTGSGGQLGG